jgi:predicted RNase H-like HicB family nuclease
MRQQYPARRRIDLRDVPNQNQAMKKELTFDIEQEEGGFVAVCHDPEMATQGDTLEELVAMIRDLVKCRFDEGDEHLGWPIRLHFVRDPVLVDVAA